VVVTAPRVTVQGPVSEAAPLPAPPPAVAAMPPAIAPSPAPAVTSGPPAAPSPTTPPPSRHRARESSRTQASHPTNVDADGIVNL
jgi:hypothetical protein